VRTWKWGIVISSSRLFVSLYHFNATSQNTVGRLSKLQKLWINSSNFIQVYLLLWRSRNLYDTLYAAFSTTTSHNYNYSLSPASSNALYTFIAYRRPQKLLLHYLKHFPPLLLQSPASVGNRTSHHITSPHHTTASPTSSPTTISLSFSTFHLTYSRPQNDASLHYFPLRHHSSWPFLRYPNNETSSTILLYS
jgi:hypothetical protein